MPTLFLKCRKCGVEFPTPIGVTDAGLQGSIIISGLTHRCPNCGVEDQYYTTDYFVHKKEAEAAGAGSTATISGDKEADEKTQRESQADRLAGFAVEGEPRSKTDGPPPAGDSPPGG